MKIFITGATGFIGKYLVERLINEGHNLTINLFSSSQSPFGTDVKSYRLNESEIAKDIEFFKVEQFDGVIHLASLYLTIHKPEEAVKLIDNNVRFSTHILECAVQSSIKWFINTGTFWQNYENVDYSPVNLYAASKQAFESIAKYYIDTDKIHFSTIKLSDTYGPNDTRPKIFNLWSRIAKSGETLEMSKGEQEIDITYIDDIIEAFALLTRHLENKDIRLKNGNVYATKAKTRYCLKDLAKIFEDATNQKLNIVWGGKPYREREVMVPWEDGLVVPDWEPKISLNDGIKCLNL